MALLAGLKLALELDPRIGLVDGADLRPLALLALQSLYPIRMRIGRLIVSAESLFN